MRCRPSVLALLALTVTIGAQRIEAQEIAMAKPRFIATWVAPGEPDDASGASVLQRRVSLDLGDVPIGVALRQVAGQARLDLSYDKSVLPVGRRVSLHAQELTVVAALTEILVESGLDVAVGRGGQLGLVRKVPAAAPDSGTIAGQVTDKAGREPLVGAAVTIGGTRRATTSGEDGRYRIEGVPVGSYTVRARYIGYTPGSVSVTVTAGQEVTADFPLEKSVQQLNEVVTTGTVVPTEVKAIPTPVTVITGDEIERQHVRRADQLFRQVVPGGVAEDWGALTALTSMSVRGASSLSGGQGTLKIYVDGIEVADRTFAGIDPSTIDRIEVIRGPEAAAIYGSGAIGGVMQVFTKRGDANRSRPQAEAEAGAGVVQSPYQGSGAPRQEYKASIRGGTPTASYQFGGGYAHTGDWVPQYTASSPSLFGGLHLAQGKLGVDVSGRYYAQKYTPPVNPRLAATGFVPDSIPFYQQANYSAETFGVGVGYAATSWWQHNLTVGVDRLGQDNYSTRARLTTPADTFLALSNYDERRATMAYSTSVTVPFTPAVSAVVTAGLDHYVLTTDGFFTSGALTTKGTVQTDPSQPATPTHDVTINTGYFGQMQLNLRDALFLTGALRAEHNSNFGSDLGTPLSPRAGLSYVHRLGALTAKLRGSYGEAIDPPLTFQKYPVNIPSCCLAIPNPLLGPARQTGGDGGIDLELGPVGSISFTYYNQLARDLIQPVVLSVVDGIQTQQYQNVARVKNTGFEFEGTLEINRVALRAQYAITRSEVEELGPNYTGDLRAGDQVFLTPRHTAGASLTYTPFARTTVTAGLTYVGDRTYYDFIAFDKCFAGNGPCHESLRDYQIAYPSFVKLNLTMAQSITPAATGFISVENLGNVSADEVGNLVPVQGRITTIGLRVALGL